MKGWRKVRLGECCEIVSGATPNTNDANYWDGNICWATPKDLSGLQGHYISDTPRKLTDSGLASCSAAILPPNSVLFSSRAPIGHVAINTVPMATNQGFKSLVPGPNLDAKFLFHWLRANRSFLENLGVGATFKEVSKAVVTKVQMPLPDLPEQRRIAAILDKTDSLRTKRREVLAQLDRLAQSTFVEMFGNPSSSQTQFETRSLSDACAKISDGTHHSPPIQQEGVPYITAKHLKRHGLDFFADPWYISRADHEEIYARCDPQPGDVLYIKDGATTGVAAINKYDFSFSMLSSLALIRPRPERLLPAYLCEWLNQSQVKTEILGAMAGAAIRRLTLAKIKAIRVPVPPLRLQKEFADRLASIEGLRAVSVNSTASLEELFASLQFRAFRGEL